MNRARLIAVARGDEAPDLVVRGAQVFNVFTKEWLTGDLAIAEGRFAGIGDYPTGESFDATGAYAVPGFIDAHVHIESSKLVSAQFARAVLPHGTTAVVTDPHEVANVLGTDGVHWMLDSSSRLPFDVYVMAPSCVPASHFESPRRPFTIGDLESILQRTRALGVAEMMNFPGVIAGDPDELAKLELPHGTHVDGHAPGVTGAAGNAYAAAGIRSDHESMGLEEALAKRRNGMWVLIREASGARNLIDLLPLVKEYGSDFCAFCTDDREPDFLIREGHINQMVRLAVQEGVPVEDALVMGSLGGALCHGLDDHGAIAPGYRADFSLIPDLESFRPLHVFKDGVAVVSDGKVLDFEVPEVPLWAQRSVHITPVTQEDLAIEHPGGPVRIIGLVPGQLITTEEHDEPTVEGGRIVADPSRDIARIAVIERHHATGRIGSGLVTGFGLERGAFASTVAHDAHNLVVVGVNDADMVACIDRLAAIGGGIAVADGGSIVAELPLPVAGLMSDRPVEEVVAALDTCQGALEGLGVDIEAPFGSLSFLALSVIPSLKLTDHGLIDVDRSAIVPLALEGSGGNG